MELAKIPYNDILEMPVNKVEKYLNWKMKFDEELAKAKADKLEQI